MTRSMKIKLAIGAVVVPVAAAGIAAAGATGAPGLSGETYAVYAETTTGFLPRTAYAVLPATGGYGTADGEAVSLAGTIEASALNANVTGAGDLEDASVQAYSTLGSVNILGGLIKAEGIVAMTASMVRTGSTGSNASGSHFARIEVAGTVLNPDIAPNTTLPLPGVGSVTLNEQIPGGDGSNSTSLTVNMIHVRLKHPLTGAQTGEIIAGSARSSVAR
jgi:hypothetical protein